MGKYEQEKGMLKNSGSQEKKKPIGLEKSFLIIYTEIKGRKSKFFIFLKNIFFSYYENKLRLSPYPRTASGNPKLKLWLSLSVPEPFSYPLKTKVVFKRVKETF